MNMRPLLSLLLLLAIGYGFTKSKASPTSLTKEPDLFLPFNHLPDSGSACSLTLYVERGLDALTGHAFLQLTKSNNQDSVVQYIGFYRINPTQSLFSDQPVPAKIMDDAYHPYHASIGFSITAMQLRRLSYRNCSLPVSLSATRPITLIVWILHSR